MTSDAYSSLLRNIESLYQAVVSDPEAWGPQAFSDWATETLSDTPDLPKTAIREVRRSLRAAQKLQEFWASDRSHVSDHNDWRTRVDIALGVRAWRPLLDLARIGLDETPNEELYEQVKERFGVVTSDRWMDGVSFDQWRTSR